MAPSIVSTEMVFSANRPPYGKQKKRKGSTASTATVLSFVALAIKSSCADYEADAVGRQPRDLNASPPSNRDPAERKFLNPPPVPCHDTNPSCYHWATMGECNSSEEYMSDNCPLSCNLCNPLSSVAQDKHGNKGIYQQEPGREQKRSFHDIGHMRFTRWIEGIETHADGIRQKRVPVEDVNHWDPGFASTRVEDVLLAQDQYLDRLRDEYSRGLKASEEGRHGEIDIAVSSMCLNHSEFCALWAARGFCDSHPHAMRASCALACQTCLTYLPGLAEKGTDNAFSTFYERRDLIGMLEAIHDQRMVMPSETLKTDSNESDGDKSSPGVFGQSLKARTLRDLFGLNTMKVESVTEMDAVPRITKIDNFLDDEEVNGIMEFLRARGTDSLDGDGFAPATKDVVHMGPDGSERIVRRSSRTFIANTLSHKPKDPNAMHPIFYKIATKIELMAGIFGKDQLDLPIRFEKFEEGGFQRTSLHFGTSVDAEPALADLLLDYDYTVGKMPYGEDTSCKSGENPNETCCTTERPDSIIAPRTMFNPPTFGLTIFLNDLNGEGAGGEIMFPHVTDEEFTPRKGTALFYPTVYTLIGFKDSEYDWGGNKAMHLLDKDYEGGDGTFLEEDLEMSIKHKRVKKGTKYSLQIYFRRFRYDSWKPSDHKIETYNLEGRSLDVDDIRSHVRSVEAVVE